MSQQNPNYRWFVVVVFFFFMLLHQTDKLMIGSLQVQISETFGLDDFKWGLVNSGALAVATGLKLANHELTVLATGGDGDGYGIGGNHFVHSMRRNIDLTYIVMDNQIYGLTKGQLSPTSPRGVATASSQWGSLEAPVNPLLYVLAYGAGFVAQGTPADMAGLARVIEEAIRFPGFAFVNVESPCITFGHPESQLRQHKARMQPLATLGHDPADKARALALAQDYGDKLYTGVLYRDPEPRPTYESQVRLRQRELAAEPGAHRRVLDAFRLS